MDAFADPETTAVWCARGGYGVVRILSRIDFEIVRSNPKVFVGFSDITTLHLTMQNRCGLVTFHGPNLQDGFGAPEDMTATTQAALWRAVLAEEQPVAQQGYAFDLRNSYAADLRNSYAADLKASSRGIATGRLTGGNLSVLCGLMGTPYEIETAGRILFLEDVDEPPYRVDRFLSQLSLAGKLQNAAGILLGRFSFDDNPPPDAPSLLEALFQEYLAPLGIPVLAGFPAGHIKENWTLPMNALVELNADAGSVSVLENPVG
jgi:muramoyltetrapeptide carboxypeptidase